MSAKLAVNFTITFVPDGVSESASFDVVKDPVFFFAPSSGSFLSGEFDIAKNKPSGILPAANPGGTWSLSGTTATIDFGTVFTAGITITASGTLIFG